MADALPEILALEPTEADSKLRELYHQLQSKSSFPELQGAAKEDCGSRIPELVSAESECRASVLCVLRVLSRDPGEMEALFGGRVLHCLMDMAGLGQRPALQDPQSPSTVPPARATLWKEWAAGEVEAVKILCNVGFQSEALRRQLGEAAPFGRLTGLLGRRQDSLPLRRFRLRLFFVLTIREPALRERARRDLQALTVLATVLAEFAKVSVTVEEAEILEELLKSLYNVAMTLPGSKVIEEVGMQVCR